MENEAAPSLVSLFLDRQELTAKNVRFGGGVSRDGVAAVEKITLKGSGGADSGTFSGASFQPSRAELNPMHFF